MFKKAWFRSARRSLKHAIYPIDDLPQVLEGKKDTTWEKYVSLATWTDDECKEIVDFDFWLDIDASGGKDSLPTEAAVQASKPNCHLLLHYLANRLKIDSEAIQTYFSGHAGFHLLLPFTLPRDGTFPEERVLAAAKGVVREIVSDLEEQWQGTSKIDSGIYTRSRIFRVPYSLHRKGLRKVLINCLDLELTVPDFLKLVDKRSALLDGQYSLDWLKAKGDNEVLQKWFMDKLSPFQVRQRSKNPTAPSTKDVDTRSDFPSCLNAILQLSKKLDWQKLTFNEPKMFVLGQLKALGYTKDAAIEIAKQFADDYTQFRGDSSNKGNTRQKDVEDAARTIFDRDHTGRYDFKVPNKCFAIFCSYPATGKIPCRDGNCPRANSDLPFPTVGRKLDIPSLLKIGLKANELLLYLIVAIEGPFKQKKQLEKRLGLHKGTVASTIASLRAKNLLFEDKGKIWARKPVRKSAMANF